jgi:outer membrane protein assembly factor BamB
MLSYAWCLKLLLPIAATVAGCQPASQPTNEPIARPTSQPTGQAGAFDWPQWQGPDRNAISKETGLLKLWPKEGPPLAWKVKDLGGGYSAPSVAAGRIFGMSTRGDDEVVWALDEKNGNPLWVARLGTAYTGQRMPQGIEGPGCTPTVDGERLYVVGRGGDVACLQVDDGKIVWQRSMTQDFGGRVPTWSYHESPLVDGNKVICTPGGPDATLAALDKVTGKTIWQSKLPGGGGGSPGGPDRPGRGRGRGGFGGGGASYASAIAIDVGGQREYVQLTARTLVGVAATDGKFLWRYDRPANQAAINCSAPIYQDGRVFAASAYGAGGGLAKLTPDGNGGVKAEEVYATRKMENHHGGMILLDGYLYGANGGNGGGYLICLDFQTGKVMWDERDKPRRQGVKKGSVALADGRIYYLQEDGTVVLFEPSPKEYLERGRFKHPDRSEPPDWTHPVIANGKLYLRDQDTLLCYNVKAE